MVTIAEIQARTAARFNVPIGAMKSPSRCRDVARPRQVAMMLSCLLTRHSRRVVGQKFGGRDPTTVLHACRQVDRLMHEDERVRVNVEAVLEALA